MNFPLFFIGIYHVLSLLTQHFVAIILLVTMTEEGYVLIILNTVNVAYLHTCFSFDIFLCDFLINNKNVLEYDYPIAEQNVPALV